MPSYALTSACRSVAGACALAVVAISPLTAAHADAMTVTSITSTPSPAYNNSNSSTTTKLTVQGTGIPASATLQLTPTFTVGANAAPIQNPITVSGSSADGQTWTGTTDLTGQAAGAYQVALVSGADTGTCTCTFIVTMTAPPDPSQVSPPALGQGASTTMTIAGFDFTRGASVAFTKADGSADPDFTVGQVSYVSPTKLTVPVTAAANAKVGRSNAANVVVTVPNGTNPDHTPKTASGSCAACMYADPPPTVTDVDPKTLGQGAVTTLTITGTGFAAGAKVTFDNGITTTDKPSVLSDTEITVPIKVASTAPATVNVTVTNADFGAATANPGLTINPGPTITKIDPAYVGNSFSGPLTVTGTGFASGATLSFPVDSGVSASLNGTPTISPDGKTYSVPIDVSRTDPAVVDVTLTNPDQGAAVCSQCLTVALPPADVTNLGATRSGTTAMVNWAAVPDADAGGAPITGYTVSVLQPAKSGIAPQTVTTTTASFTGVSTKLNYTFKVVATNAAKLSSKGVVASTGGQNTGTTLALSGNSTKLVAGQRLTVSGKMADAAGNALSGDTILVTARDAAGQTTALGTATTDASGGWTLSTTPKHNATYVASFSGDDQNASATSHPLSVTVAPRVTISAPSTTSSAHPLVVTGSVSPNKAGKAVRLTAVDSHGTKKDLGTTTLSSTSSYKFRVKLGKGTWTLVVRIGSTSGNTAGHSKGRTVTRT